jgi:hypothetical protein
LRPVGESPISTEKTGHRGALTGISATWEAKMRKIVEDDAILSKK